MRKPLIASVACVAAMFLGSSPATAADPVAATFTDECGFVRIAYPAGVTGDFEVKRDGQDVTSVPMSLPEGGSVAIVAQAGQSVSVTGVMSGSHTHVTPAGCDEPKVSLVSVEDRCQNHSAVTLRNGGTAAVSGYRIIRRGMTTEIPALPPGDSTHVIQDAYLLTILWTSPGGTEGHLASYLHVAPAGCGSSALQQAFADKCGTLEWTLTNNSEGKQLVVLAKGTEVVLSQWVPPGGPHTYSVPAAEGESFQPNYWGDGKMGEPHTYYAPASCAAGGLPITGSSTQTLVLIGVLLVASGFGALVLARARRRRV